VPVTLTAVAVPVAGARPAESWRDQAWALKHACYAAWSSEPLRAVQAARDLRALSDALLDAIDSRGPVLPRGQVLEVVALADWTEGIAHLTQGRLEPACVALDRAASAFVALGQALQAAETQVPKIMGLSLLGRLDEAAQCGEAAEQTFVEQGNTLAAAKVSLNLGSLQLRRDAHDAAARHYRAAAVRFARVGDHEHSVMADIGLADALTALGQIDEARRMLARAGMRAQTHGLPVLQAMADESAALLALVCGRYRDALAGFERSRRAYAQMQMPQHLAVAEKQLADAYLELRLLPEALVLYAQAVRRFEELDMPAEQAWALAQQGRALALTGRGAQAEAAWQRASVLFDGQHLRSGSASVSLARCELVLAVAHPDVDVALALADAASVDFEAAGIAEGVTRAEALRGRALFAASRLSLARGAFGTVQARAQAMQLLSLQAQALTGQGLVAEVEGRLDAAQRAFEQAMALTEHQRRALPGDEIRSAFLADHLGPYQGLLRLALRAHDAGDPGAAVNVLQRLDGFRARALADRLQHGPAAGADPVTDQLRAHLNWLYRRALRQSADAVPSTALAAQVQEAERSLLERGRRERLASEGPIPAAPAVVDPAEVQAQLGALDALVAYGIDGDELFACVVTTDGIHLQRRLASWHGTQQLLRSLRFQLDSLRVGTVPLEAHLPLLTRRALARLQQVHASIWAPLAPSLAAARRVLVVPQGPLSGVPFAALHDGQHPLVAHHEVAVASSVQVALHGLRRHPQGVASVCAFGSAGPLPHVEGEARRVAARFAGGRAFVGAEATLAALAREAPQADLLHLACHAQFRGDNPMFSALQLADGALTAEAVEQLRLGPCTVVLSACDTALSSPDAADDRVGLVRAFLVAGAARVLASLWPVDDALTDVFMQRFHAGLAGGAGPASALRQAQLDTMQEQPHPCHWAAFTLYGGW
jgi:CHAT domain-containing protein